MKTNILSTIEVIKGGAIAPFVLGTSPAVYQNTSNQAQNAIVSGGTVTQIEFSRDGVSWILSGLLGGGNYLNPNDYLRVTYVVKPNLVIFPV